MSGEVNMIPTLREIRGGASPSKFGGGQSRDIFRGGPVKKPPCIKSYCSALSNCFLHVQMKNETLGNMQKVLTDKALLNTTVATSNMSDFLMAEAEFKRVELSCKTAFQS